MEAGEQILIGLFDPKDSPEARTPCSLVVGAYDEAGEQLLGACCSPPIRVLANNDVPTGAAYIALTLPLRNDWEGWRGGPFTVRHLAGRML